MKLEKENHFSHLLHRRRLSVAVSQQNEVVVFQDLSLRHHLTAATLTQGLAEWRE